MTSSDFSIALRNYAGVPVVELVGEIDKTILSKVEDILGKLVCAGHYNVMINLKRAVCKNLTVLSSLEEIARILKTHYGDLDIIAELDQINGFRRSGSLAKLFRCCTSEGQALRRIRKLPAPSAGGAISMSARLADSY